MPRFVLLEHDHPARHWDLMLECGDILRTWRLAQPPRAGAAIAAAATFDHRLVYLDYEGPISGNRGRVIRRDAGTFSWQRQDVEYVEVRLEGGQLRGVLRLEQVAGDSWRGEFIEEPASR
jgi:hypothetical protein